MSHFFSASALVLDLVFLWVPAPVNMNPAHLQSQIFTRGNSRRSKQGGVEVEVTLAP